MAYPSTLQEKIIKSMIHAAVYWLDPQQVITPAKRTLMLKFLDHGQELNSVVTDILNGEDFTNDSTYDAVDARITALVPFLELVLTLRGQVPA